MGSRDGVGTDTQVMANGTSNSYAALVLTLPSLTFMYAHQVPRLMFN